MNFMCKPEEGSILKSVKRQIYRHSNQCSQDAMVILYKYEAEPKLA
jgi:hypothetical protein